MPEPRFKPGDFVVSKTQVEALRLWPERFLTRINPLLFQVTQVVPHTCSEGTQIFYECRCAGTAGVDRDKFLLQEIELDPAPTEPAPEKE